MLPIRITAVPTLLPALLVLLALLTLLAAQPGCRGGAPVAVLEGTAFGTSWSVRLPDRPDLDHAGIAAALQEELAQVDAQMSLWQPGSDLARYNRAPAGSWQVLPEPMVEVLAAALELASETDGAYDPTVGPLVALWGFGPAPARMQPPTAEAIAQARARVGFRRLRFDLDRRLLLQPGDIELDLNSIAEGHAIDRLAERLERLGIGNFLVELGGELRARGHHPGGRPWRVALERPGNGHPQAGRVLAIGDHAVATSGDYRAGFEHGGRRYSHTIDPRTGWPVAHALASVTVVDATATRAGALATALSVLGPTEGLAFAERHGVAAVFQIRGEDGLLERSSGAFQQQFGGAAER